MTNFTYVGLSENLTSSYDCLSYNAWSNAFYVTDGGEALQFHSSFPALYGDRISIVLPEATTDISVNIGNVYRPTPTDFRL